MTPRVVLIGLPGSGKTSSGRRLAKVLAVPFADSDDLVQTATGCTVRELFEDRGEAAFRAVEAEVIATALRDFAGVLALGGGAVTDAATRTALRASGAPLVHLRAPVRTLRTRVGDARSRPLLAEDPDARLSALALEREPFYRELATFEVDTAARTPGQVAARIAARLHERSPR